MDAEGPSSVTERWQELLVDAAATASEYEESGWEPLVIRPGDVTPLDGEPFGLDVLVPGDQFETLTALVDDVAFDTSHVYRDDESGVRFCIVVVEATADEIAVVVPAYFDVEETTPLEQRAREEGVMYTHVRSLSGDGRVTFSHEDPELFF